MEGRPCLKSKKPLKPASYFAAAILFSPVQCVFKALPVLAWEFIPKALGPLNTRVNTIAPGPTQTGYISAEFEQEITDQIPLKRIGTPQEIADVAIFLASHQARWLTGQVIKVSGGHAL